MWNKAVGSVYSLALASLAVVVVIATPNWVSANSTTLVIERFVYDGTTPTYEGDEYVKIYNMTDNLIDVSDFKIGDAETEGESTEGMYYLQGNIPARAYIIVAKNATQFRERWGFDPDFELVTSGSGFSDTPGVPDLSKYSTYATGNWELGNSGDNILLLNGSDAIVDSVAWGSDPARYSEVGLVSTGDYRCPSGSETKGLRRKNLAPSGDTDNMYNDFANDLPTEVTFSSFSANAAFIQPSAWSWITFAVVTVLGIGAVTVRRRKG